MPFPQIASNFNPNKSVFKKNSYAFAIGNQDNPGHSVIKIKPKGAVDGILGVIKNNISFSVEANWTDMASIGSSVLPIGSNVRGIFEKASGIANVLGLASLGSSFASKLIYQKSGRLSISPEMRIVDWNGTGQPLFSSLLIANFCLPSGSINLIDPDGNYIENVQKKGQELYQSFKSKQTETGVKVLNTTEKISEGVQKNSKVFGNILKGAIDSVMGEDYSNEAAKEAFVDLDDITTLRKSPKPVNIEIGHWFSRKDMVITNASFEFSKELTKNGPLYVDIKLDLQSRKIMTGRADVGIIDPLKNELNRSSVI